MIVYVDDPDISGKIRELMADLGLTREEFCRRAGISEDLYDAIQADGEMEFSYEALKKVSDLLSCPIDDLLASGQM